jgi:hypothetical protein
MQPGCTKDVMQARSFMFQVENKFVLRNGKQAELSTKMNN